MAKWIICDDPSFYRCSDCNTLSDWRDHYCEKCKAKMEDTGNLTVQWGEYEVIQYGGDFNISVRKNGKRMMHAIRTERATKEELIEFAKDIPRVLQAVRERGKKCQY